MDRPWFRRLWVLQEVNFASSRTIMQCGYDTTSYYCFRRAVACLRARSETPANLHLSLDYTYPLTYGPQNVTMWDLISIAQDHACVECHDKIYAMLGFFGPLTRAIIKPSYEKPCTQVFKEVLLDHSEITARMGLLTYCSPNEKSTLPTYVPSWKSRDRSGFVHSPPHSQAAGLSRSYFRRNETVKLEVDGLQVATISSLFEELPVSSLRSAAKWLRALIADIAMSDLYPTGETMHTALLKVLSQNETDERFSDKLGHEYIGRWVHGLQDTKDKILPGISELVPTNEMILSPALSRWRRRRFFRTADGYLGFGPHELSPGYSICVLLGLYYPLIIRPTGDGEYSVIGTCYIHGFMDGEALLGHLPTDWSVAQWTVQGRFQPRYYCSGMNFKDAVLDDPRLEPLDSQWRRLERDLTADDLEHVAFFENQSTRDIVNYDPRMSKEALERRGVRLQTITLV